MVNKLLHNIVQHFQRRIAATMSIQFVAKSHTPFVELNFGDSKQKTIYDRVVEATREIYRINEELNGQPAKRITATLQRQKESLISEIQRLIGSVYRLEF